jgi:hypothetical protein
LSPAGRLVANKGVRTLLAMAYAELERYGDAREELELLARRDFADVPRDGVWLPMTYGLSLVAAQLSDTRRAEQLYELLLPYADRCAVAFSVLCWGSVSRPLGPIRVRSSRKRESYLLARPRGGRVKVALTVLLGQ